MPMLQRIFLITILLTIGLSSQSPSPLPTSSHYVEPALLTQVNSVAQLQSHQLTAPRSFSVIVTATDAAIAARAVEQIGGQVTSQLWLIDAVGARAYPPRNLNNWRLSQPLFRWWEINRLRGRQ